MILKLYIRKEQRERKREGEKNRKKDNHRREMETATKKREGWRGTEGWRGQLAGTVPTVGQRTEAAVSLIALPPGTPCPKEKGK